jgi:hypothetical protein
MASPIQVQEASEIPGAAGVRRDGFLGPENVVQPAPLGPNLFVRCAFYLSLFSVPFVSVYFPGTGGRVGILRLIQLLLFGAVISQPRVCLRLVPVGLLWFISYCAIRIVSGWWMASEPYDSWLPATLEWLEYSLPWVWIAFNLLQFPRISRAGLWAFATGVSLCALLHIVGIGASAVDQSIQEARTTVFGQNANVVGAMYAVAIVALIGLGMFREVKLSRRLLIIPMVGVIGVGLAKTGSRTAVILVVIGALVLLFQAESFSPRWKRYGSLALIGGMLAVAVLRDPTVMERFRDLDPQNPGRLNPRMRMAPVLLEIFLRSPIYGSGPDQYEFELTRRAMPYVVRDQRLIASHNLVLLLLVETGLIGFLVFFGGLWKALTAAWRARFNYCGYLPLALLLPLLISGIVLSNPTHHHVFWLAIAYALAGAA